MKRPRPHRPASTHPVAATGRARRPLLTIAMIVRDEESRLGECLRSLGPGDYEIVVLDTGSKDRTREVALECGARVYEMEWPDSFAEARNESLKHARGKWILWLDADDVCPPGFLAAIFQLIASCPNCDAAFTVAVRIPPPPGQFRVDIVDHLKLFPNRPDIRFEHRIHEQVLESIQKAGLGVIATDLFVVHQNYDRSPEGQAKKRKRDRRLLYFEMKERPDHAFPWFNMGMTYLESNREYEVAAYYLGRCLEISNPQASIVHKAYAMLTTARWCQGEFETALRANEEGRGLYPDDAELLFQAGKLYQEFGRMAEARTALERLVTGNDGPQYRSAQEGLRTYQGLHELALLYRRLGDVQHCADVLKQVVSQWPDYEPARGDLEAIAC